MPGYQGNLTDWIVVNLTEKNMDAIKEMSKVAADVVTYWKSEIHDCREVASDVLKRLGPAWEQRVESIFPPAPQNYFAVLTTPHLPASGHNRTRVFKRLINVVLEMIYQGDKDFKLFRKYNPEQRAYSVYNVQIETMLGKSKEE